MVHGLENVLGALAACTAGARQELVPLLEVTGTAKGDCFGAAVAGGGDIDGDGRPDFVVGAYSYAQQVTPLATLQLGTPEPLGFIRALSGADGHVLHAIPGTNPGFGFGLSVAGVGDLDRDGCADFLVGSTPQLSAKALLHAHDGARSVATASVYSGKDGTKLATLKDPSSAPCFAVRGLGLGDVDGDEHPDMAVAFAHGLGDGGQVVVYSGWSLAVLFTLSGKEGEGGFGENLASAGDVDGDGTADLIIGAPRAAKNGRGSGMAVVVSGRSGTVIHALHGREEFSSFGGAVAGLGDVDGDGRSDLLVCARGTSDNAGAAFVYSGSGGRLLYALDHPGESDEFGIACCALRDVSGDGVPDMAITTNRDGPRAPGRARVFSGKDGTLLGSFPGMSVASIGDIDGDGYDDLAAGVDREDPAGIVRVFSVRKALASGELK